MIPAKKREQKKVWSLRKRWLLGRKLKAMPIDKQLMKSKVENM